MWLPKQRRILYQPRRRAPDPSFEAIGRPCARHTPLLDYALRFADVAQLVEHNLAKVGVAGSNPVVRSKHSRRLVGRARCEGPDGQPSLTLEAVRLAPTPLSATWPSGKAGACKALIPSSNLGVASRN